MEHWKTVLENLVIRALNSKLEKPTPHIPTNLNYLGLTVPDGEAFEISSADLARHAYILGATGCGKTSLILKLIEQDIRNGKSIAVIDLRGDLIAGAIGICANLQVPFDRVKLLDLREPKRVAGFNPLTGPGEAHIRALHVLDVLQSESESWGVQLEESLRNALLLLTEAKAPLTALERVFLDEAFRSGLLRQCTDDSVIGFWSRYAALSEDRQQAWVLPVLNKVTPLMAARALRESLGSESPIDLRATLSKPGQILLVSLAVDELHRSGRMLGSLVVSSISREMMSRVNVPEKNRNPVRLYVDEFENMASDSFEGLIAEGRRFGLTLVLSHQILTQLPPKLRSVIRNNVGLQMLFQCGYEDARQLARELPPELESYSLRALEVGQAFVMDRTGKARLIQFNPPPKPAPKLIHATYRESLLKRLPPNRVQKSTSTQTPPKSQITGLEDWA